MPLVHGYRAVTRKAILDSISLPAFILLTTMMGYGSLAHLAGFDVLQAMVATILIWGLPGQLAMVELVAQGQGLIPIVMACSLANARFLPMVVSFLPHVSTGKSRLPGLLLLSQMLSINSWAVSLREFPSIMPEWRRYYYVVFALSIVSAALAGSALGVHTSANMPRAVVLGFIFLSPMFFALVLISARGASVRLSLVCGCLTIPLAHKWFPSVDLLLTGSIAGTCGFWLARIEGVRKWME